MKASLGMKTFRRWIVDYPTTLVGKLFMKGANIWLPTFHPSCWFPTATLSPEVSRWDTTRSYLENHLYKAVWVLRMGLKNWEESGLAFIQTKLPSPWGTGTQTTTILYAHQWGMGRFMVEEKGCIYEWKKYMFSRYSIINIITMVGAMRHNLSRIIIESIVGEIRLMR